MLPFVDYGYDHPYPPRVTAFTHTFWEALKAGRFLTTQGRTTGRLTFPPKPLSPYDWNEPVDWTELSGRGRLYTYTTMHAVPAVFQFEAPYRVCVVDLNEGIRLATRLIGDEAELDGPIQLVAVRYSNFVCYAARMAKVG